jgi:dolichol-phosphate mannosyltransferase
MINLSSDLELPVDAGDFKLLSRRVVDHLLHMKESRPYSRGLIAWVGFRQTFVEYIRDARHSGDSHFRFYGKSAIFQLFNGITAFSALPIYLVLISGVLLFVAAVALGIVAIFVSGPAVSSMSAFTLIGFLILIWSSILMALGVIGLYVSRIDQNVRNRPRFIVKDVLGIEEEVDRSDY